jgi:hypothetical protein
MANSKIAIVTGMIATYPVGGVVWDYGQYLLGLESLGYDVYYLEDTGCPTYDPRHREYTDDCRYGVEYLARSLKGLSPSLERRWHFRSCTNECFGLNSTLLHKLAASADLLLNVSGGTLLRDAYMTNPCKVIIDSDPGWNHFVNFPKWDANPGWQGTHGYRAHDHYLTYAERIGANDCLLPTLGLPWQGTRPPVDLGCWENAPGGESWTTVMTWNNFRQPVEYDGKIFGTKEIEFPKIESVPSAIRTESFTLAVGGSEPPVRRWQDLGWNVVDSHDVSISPEDYRQFIRHSRGEISVAKNLYVDTRSGWFSCRSVCYLAAGLPAVVQDTGFTEFLPTGEGLIAFENGHEATEAIRQVAANYRRHQQAARELARECFAADRVLGKLLSDVGLR